MPPPVTSLLCALAGFACALALGACGSSSSSSSSTSIPRYSAPTTSTSTPATTPTPRTSPEPSTGGTSADAAAAEATVKRLGYTVADPSTYKATDTLRVLIGVRTGSADGRVQQAFFFVGGRYIGTDTKDPSAAIRVVGHDDTTVTLRYALYKRGDPLCCPHGGHADVRYQLDNGKLSPLDPIPSASGTAPLSRE
jgi:hypothetical protein